MASLAELLGRGDWAKAEQVLRREATRRDAPAAVHYNLAKVLVEAGKAAQAGAWFRKAVKRDPCHAAAWFELGRWHLGHDDLVQALEPFTKAAALRPDDRDAWVNLGRIALRLCHWDTARMAWSHAPGAEADRALYRIAAETGAADTAERRDRLLAEPAQRAEVITTLTRTAKGRLPLVLPLPADIPG